MCAPCCSLCRSFVAMIFATKANVVAAAGSVSRSVRMVGAALADGDSAAGSDDVAAAPSSTQYEWDPQAAA